jgi:ABC-type transport system substrate-binding protein
MILTPRGCLKRSSPPQSPRKPAVTPLRTALPLLFAAFCIALALPSGCLRNDDRPQGVLRLRLNGNPTTLDPALISDVQGGGIAAKLFNGLVRFDENLEVAPDLARSWTVSDDGRTYTFRLRRDARFSNGRPITASDFQYSFERVLTPATKAPLTWVLDKIEGADAFLAGKAAHITGVRVPDEHTLVVAIERPFAPFISLLAMTAAYVVPREEVGRLGPAFGVRPVGSGPYILSEWKHGQSLTLSANKDYFEGRPRLNGIHYRIIPEDLTAVLEFETGRLDVLQLPSSEYRRYTTDPLLRSRVIGRPGLNTYYLGLNCARPPFDDVRVRRAVNMAIDRRRILDTLMEKRGLPADGPVPPELWKCAAWQPAAEGRRYDPDKARALIHEAGADGAIVTIYISAEQEVIDIVEVLADYLRKSGLQPEIVQRDWSAFKQAVDNGESNAFWLSWWADYPDPENFLYPLFHSASIGSAGNRSRCVDPELDRILDAARGVSNTRERCRLYRKAEARIVENAPWVFMWHKAEYFAVQPWVAGFKTYPLYSIDKRMDVTLTR